MFKLAQVLIVGLVVTLGMATAADAQEARKRDANQLTQVELAELNTTDALDAVRSLRPNWLNRRGQTSMRGATPVRVYIDGVPRGTVDVLRSVPIHTIASMQFLDSRTATQRWGTDHASGVIMVRSM